MIFTKTAAPPQEHHDQEDKGLDNNDTQENDALSSASPAHIFRCEGAADAQQRMHAVNFSRRTWISLSIVIALSLAGAALFARANRGAADSTGGRTPGCSTGSTGSSR